MYSRTLSWYPKKINDKFYTHTISLMDSYNEIIKIILYYADIWLKKKIYYEMNETFLFVEESFNSFLFNYT